MTKNGGMIEVKDVTEGLWSFVETEAPAGYCADSTPISVYVDTTDGDKQYTVTAENHKLPDMKITKRDAMSGKPIAGTVFSVKSVTGNFSTSVTTGTDGSATLSAIPAGVYVVREESVPEPYIVSSIRSRPWRFALAKPPRSLSLTTKSRALRSSRKTSPMVSLSRA